MAIRPRFRLGLRVVFYREDDEVVAHCLECDLVGTGSSRAAALRCLEDAISTQVEFAVEQNSLEVLFRQAPPEVMARYAIGKDLAECSLSIPVPADDRWEFTGEGFRESDESETPELLIA